MLTLEHQDTEFVLDSLLDTQPVEAHQYWCDMFVNNDVKTCNLQTEVGSTVSALLQLKPNWLAVWLSGNALASINVVALRQTRSVPGSMGG